MVNKIQLNIDEWGITRAIIQGLIIRCKQILFAYVPVDDIWVFLSLCNPREDNVRGIKQIVKDKIKPLHSKWSYTRIFILVNCKLVKFDCALYLFNFWTHDITKILVASILICLIHMVSDNSYIKLYMVMWNVMHI